MRWPPVTIAILNYQRKDTLRLVLQAALAQDYPSLEVLVVDNASTDGSDRMVEEEFPGVRLVRLPRNVGCAARNAGVAAATGDIVVTIDNDVLLMSPHDVRTIVGVLQERPSVACLNFKILDRTGALSRRDWCHPRAWREFADHEFLTDYVLEGASAFRRHVFERVGGYWPLLFLGHEGLDLALRILDTGHDLLYSPRVCVTHLVSGDARPSSRIYYTYTRNSIWVSLRNHRPFVAARAIAEDMALMAFASLRARQLASYLSALRDGLRGTRDALATRHALNRATYDRIRRLRDLKPGLIERAQRHWQEQLI